MAHSEMKMMTKIAVFGLLCLMAGLQAAAEPAWVSDQFEVMLRTGPSTTNAIERMLPSGTALEVLERDDATGYARVRTRAGTEGWILTRYLMSETSAREQLTQLRSQLDNASAQGSSLTSQLDAVKDEYDTATSRIDTLEREKRKLEQELAEIKRTSTDVLGINSQNISLREQLATLEIKLETVKQENRELTSETSRYWFMAGALVLMIGILLGIWVPRMRLQRHSRYDRF
ncbi:MAG: TIGR04211 family SH3 domain-containing protein [Proteobacteria bacterium]|nr:TIGR04211 family SH3 domain-containing protein [Pseudomonadota bacterium]